MLKIVIKLIPYMFIGGILGYCKVSLIITAIIGTCTFAAEQIGAYYAKNT